MELATAGILIYAGKQLLGKTFETISEDISKLYQKGRDKIIEKASEKLTDKNDGKTANLRVARDVFWNGSFTEEGICAEYFGGILASSRSEDGKDDSGVYYVDLIKSLSSKQLLLHYLIYSSLNSELVSDTSKSTINVGQETELSEEGIFLSSKEIIERLKDGDYGRDLFAIHAKGLIGDFETGAHDLKDGKNVPYLKVSPKCLGIQLYAVAHNKLDKWRSFAKIDFEEFKDIESVKFSGKSIEQLLKSAGVEN